MLKAGWGVFLLLSSSQVVAQSPGNKVAYEQRALDFFVSDLLPQYKFNLGFCGKTDGTASSFDHMYSCFAPRDFEFYGRLNSAATAFPNQEPVALCWTAPKLKKACRPGRKRPQLVVRTATVLDHKRYVKLYVYGRGGATHYMIELSEEGQVLRWCKAGEIF